jgi:serine/threonine-protein kinase
MSIGIPFGRYRLTRRLARGGMAEVFLATQQGPGGFERTVAVKRILPHLADTPQFLDMFMDEARLAAQLSHPNIAHIYEFGNVDDSYFIAMEYIDGVDLSVIVLDGIKKPLPLEHSARIIADLCAALHYAHQCKGQDGKQLGIVHRDISPQNILVSFDGAVKIVDFGIAKAAYHMERTKPGVVRGKYTYMSPEQVLGKSLDGRSDLFSAGIVLYELCTATPLFPRTNAVQAMQLIRKAEIPKPMRGSTPLPAKLAGIIRRALAKRREDRYQNAAEMQMDLEEFLRSSSQIVNSIVLGEYFQQHYRKLRPEPKAAPSTAAAGGTIAAKDRPAGTALAARRPGTAAVPPRSGTAAVVDPPPDAARATLRPGFDQAPSTGIEDTSEDPTLEIADVPTDIIVGRSLEDQVDVLSEDLDADAELSGPTTLVPSPPPAASGIIYSQSTSPKLAAVSGLATETQGGRGHVNFTGTVKVTSDELREATYELPPGDVDDEDDEDEVATVAHRSAPVASAIRTGAATIDRLGNSSARLPAMASTTLSVRSFGRRLLVVAMIAAVAVTGVLVGLWISDPGVPERTEQPPPAAALTQQQPELHQQEDSGTPATTGSLSISSNPTGATIKINGLEVSSVTPLVHSLAPGTHKIEASYTNYEPQAQQVALEAGQTLKVNFVLRRMPEREHHVVQVKRRNPPPAARAAAGDRRRARARAKAKAKARARARAKARARARARAKAKAKRVVRARPEPAPARSQHGYLKIFTVPWSKVYLDGRPIGITPLANVKVTTGRHQLRFVNPDRPVAHRTVTVHPDKVTKVRLNLQ